MTPNEFLDLTITRLDAQGSLERSSEMRAQNGYRCALGVHFEDGTTFEKAFDILSERHSLPRWFLADVASAHDCAINCGSHRSWVSVFKHLRSKK